MQNIHILPTSKPSRIFYIACNLHMEKGQLISPKFYRNIYITNDEEIKKRDWYISADRQISQLISGFTLPESKKIILTTDQDLIKDGVQAIDDEFLEWFVLNPSCEMVETIIEYKDGYGNWFEYDKEFWDKYGNKPKFGTKYKIIIPKEVTQGYICPQTKNQCDDECCVNAENCHIEASIGVIFESEPKQETLEEAAEQIQQNLKTTEPRPYGYIFKLGAKWQADRMYSEEEIFNFSQWISHNDWVYLPSKGYWVNEEREELEEKLSSKQILDLWFKQFKK